MKRHLLFFVLTLTGLALMAKPVDPSLARKAAYNYMNAHSEKIDTLVLASTFNTRQGIPAFYIFNTSNGFVIVAADDCATPILGYSDEGLFDRKNISLQMQAYMQNMANQIEYGIEHNHTADALTNRRWEQVLATGNMRDRRHEERMDQLIQRQMDRIAYSTTDASDTAVTPDVVTSEPYNIPSNGVAPLVTAQWDQECYYNTMCPADISGSCGHVPTGCVATAMGMIMHYWGYPAHGTGTHSYTPDGYPIQTVDFGATTYDWNNMPNQLTATSTAEQINAVSSLLWHCGVAVDMMYNAQTSSATDNLIPTAFRNYFGYSNGAYYQWNDNDSIWLIKIKSSIDRGRPLIYFATDDNDLGGHAFVCDGYNTDDLLHFNWGWGGSGNGYFAINALNVNDYQFNNGTHALFGILPPSEFQLQYNIIEGGAEVTYENSELEIPSYYDYPDTIVIPSHVTIDNTTYPVIAVGDSALRGLCYLRKVVMPNSVKSIGELSFGGSGSIFDMEVVMSDSLTIIKRDAFNNAGIRSIDLPNTLLTIEPFAFSWTHLASITIPQSLTTIGHSFLCFSYDNGFFLNIDTINWNADSCVLYSEGEEIIQWMVSIAKR